MKKILLLTLCCLALCGCEKTEDISQDNPKENYSKKMMVCIYSNNNSNFKSDNTLSFYFEEDGTLKQILKNSILYFDTEEQASSYYKDIYSLDNSLEINGKIITSSSEGDIPAILKRDNRGTFEKELAFWKNKDGYTCKVQDAE